LLSPGGATVCAWLAPFLLVSYLALKGGGYDPIVRGEVGVAIWWIVLLGTLVGVLPATRPSRAGLVALALFAALTIWMGLGISWSSSAERSVAELGRVAMYLGVLALAVGGLRGSLVRPALNGLACAIALVAGLAVLSRLHPSWFPANATADFLPGTRGRLNYPLNYWNALAAFVALGIPLMLSIAASARTLLAQAAAAAALPVLVLCAYLTFSRGGAVAMLVGVLTYLALAGDRLPQLATLLVSGTGSAILIGGATQRPAIEDGLVNSAAQREGSELLAMLLVVCAGVALIQVGIGLARRYGIRPSWMSVTRRRTKRLSAAAAAVALIAALAGGAPHALSHAWSDFKHPQLGVPASDVNRVGRFGSTSGNGRYQYWQAALHANESHPWRGIGPGTYEFWWARHAPSYSYVRNAHSLYLETLAELGIIGLGLLASLLLVALAAGVRRTIATHGADRLMLAGATASGAAFCVSAGSDWVWQVAVLPVTFLLLIAVTFAFSTPTPQRSNRVGLLARAVVAAVAVGALAAVVIPLLGASGVRASQADAAHGRLNAALDRASAAAAVQRYAASPRIQRALVLETSGWLDAAAVAARTATEQEPSNWRSWVTLSRLEAERGDVAKSVAAYRKAKELNPRSPILNP
jgi:hypothetical protein